MRGLLGDVELVYSYVWLKLILYIKKTEIIRSFFIAFLSN